MSEVTAALVLLGLGGLGYAIHKGTQKNTGGNRNGTRRAIEMVQDVQM